MSIREKIEAGLLNESEKFNSKEMAVWFKKEFQSEFTSIVKDFKYILEDAEEYFDGADPKQIKTELNEVIKNFKKKNGLK